MARTPAEGPAETGMLPWAFSLFRRNNAPICQKKGIVPLTKICTLASGSSGNALLVSHNNSHVLVDAGISVRRINAALHSFDLSIDDLDALLITHSHNDHVSALKTWVKHYDCPIYTSDGTAFTLHNRISGITPLLHSFSAGESFSVGDFSVHSFSTSHDAGDNVCYRLDTADGAVGILTDTGYVTRDAARTLQGVSMLVLESNHDVQTLLSGEYPYPLKERILGKGGHLSNDDAAAFAVTAAQSGTTDLLLAHLSQDNNTPSMALHTVCTALSAHHCDHVAVSVAPRDVPSPVHTL